VIFLGFIIIITASGLRFEFEYNLYVKIAISDFQGIVAADELDRP